MSLFNFMDTFFFISLGITFILILLLVYHFKQRMTSLEQKNDTMFEIINNIVKEITNVKQIVIKNDNISPHHIPVNMIPISPFYNDLNHESVHFSLVNKENPFSQQNTINDDDEDDNEDEDDDEDEDEEDDDEDDEDDDEHDEKKNDLIISDNIKLEYNTDLEVNEINIEESDIKVIKLDEDIVEQDDISVNKIYTNEHNKELRKMNLIQLKTIIQEKGITVDTSKMKKNELIKLIENNNV